jgi:LIM domain kinase 1
MQLGLSVLIESNLNGQATYDQPNPDSSSSLYSDYSTTVIRSHTSQHSPIIPPSFSSILTIRPSQDPTTSFSGPIISVAPSNPDVNEYHSENVAADSEFATKDLDSIASMLSIESFHTAHSSSVISTTAATEGGSTIRTLPLVHRFTLIKPGAKRTSGNGGGGSPPRIVPANGRVDGTTGFHEPQSTIGWNPLDLFFSGGLLVAKCDICLKRLGWKPVLQCDDCSLKLVEIPPPLYSTYSRSRPLVCSILEHILNAVKLPRGTAEFDQQGLFTMHYIRLFLHRRSNKCKVAHQ